jgi:VanZ family protein
MTFELTPASLQFRRLWQAVGVILIGCVIYQSLTPNPIAIPASQGDKYGHVLAYATLMFWFAQLHYGVRARLGWAIAFIAMGIALEFVQRLTDYRTFELADMAADAVGVFVGWILAPPRSPLFLQYFEAHWLTR